MPSWDLTDEELGDLIQYVKLFSPRWRDETAGEAIVPSPDPWLGRESDARAEGERVYHGRALCWACHPAYEPATAIARDEEAMQGHAAATPRPDLGRAVATVLEDGTRKLPTDFAVDPLQAGDATIDVYRDIACGLGGASMPAYRNALSERDLWALAHYVHALATARETLTAGTASE
jgi:mono/diheme cytochrome c family protein